MAGEKRADRREGTTVFVGFYLPADLARDLKHAAIELGLNYSDYAKLALTERLTKDAKLIRRG